MTTHLAVRKNPRPGTISDVREITAGAPLNPGEEQMTLVEYNTWLATLPRPVPASVSKRQLFKRLFRAHGLEEAQLRAVLANPETIPDVAQRKEALIDFDTATSVDRGNPLVAIIGAVLALSAEQMDEEFREAELL